MARQGHYWDSFSFCSDESWTHLPSGSERDAASVSSRSRGTHYPTRSGRCPRGGESDNPSENMLKKTRKAYRSQRQHDNKRKADEHSSSTANSWQAQRELDGRASPKTHRVAQDEGWTREEWKQWHAAYSQHEWEMAKHQKQMGEDTHVTVWKDNWDTTRQLYYSTYTVVTNEECKATFDPPDQPNEKKTNIETLQAAGAIVVHEDSPKQPHTVSDLGQLPLEDFTGSFAKHSYGLASNYCKTCRGEIKLVSEFACFKQAVRKGKHEYEMIVDDDAELSKMKGLPFRNLSSAKGCDDDYEVTIVHVCVHCAERLAHAPDVESPVFKDYPRIHHGGVSEGGGWRLTKKWKRAAARSLGPPSNTERSKNIRHIIEGIVEKAKRREVSGRVKKARSGLRRDRIGSRRSPRTLDKTRDAASCTRTTVTRK